MTAARKPAIHVTVGTASYGPEDEIPGDVVDLIDNPAVWGDEPESDIKAPAKRAASKSEK